MSDGKKERDKKIVKKGRHVKRKGKEEGEGWKEGRN